MELSFDCPVDYQAMEDKSAALEAQRKQALKKGRDVTAQKLAIEVRLIANYAVDPPDTIQCIISPTLSPTTLHYTTD